MEPLARRWRNKFIFGWVGECFFAQGATAGCRAGIKFLFRSVCCGELSELSWRSGYASPFSLRPLSGAEARLSELLFAAERTNSTACAPLFSLLRFVGLCWVLWSQTIFEVLRGIEFLFFFLRKCLRHWTESEQILLRDIQQPQQFRTRIIIRKFVSMFWFIPDSVGS